MSLNPGSLWLLLPHRTVDGRVKKRMCWEYVRSEILLSFYFHSCFLFPIGPSPRPWMFYILTQKWCFKLPSSAVLFHCCHRTRGRHKPLTFRRWGRYVWHDKKPKCRVEQQERQGQAQVLVGQMSCAALAVLTAACAIWAPRASPEPPRNNSDHFSEWSSWLGKDKEGPSCTFLCTLRVDGSFAEHTLLSPISPHLCHSRALCPFWPYLCRTLQFQFHHISPSSHFLSLLSLIWRVCSFLPFSGS